MSVFIREFYMKACVGIWGFGVTGKAAAHFFKKKGYDIWVMDSKAQALQEAQSLGIRVIPQKDVCSFLQQSDLLFASGGINVKEHYAPYKTKWITEVDLFAQEWRQNFPQKPIIAITGTVGKTTVTHLLHRLLNTLSGSEHAWLVGGNIGTPLFSLLEQATNQTIGVVLELSSFQLEYAKTFYPDVGIITNIYPNHLDRHGSVQEYLAAKINLLKKIPQEGHIIAPYSLYDQILDLESPAKTCFFNEDDTFLKDFFFNKADAYFLHKNCIMRKLKDLQDISLTTLMPLASLTFNINWLTIFLGAHALGFDMNTILNAAQSLSDIPKHRVAYLGSHKGLSFYNDSKATVPESTLAAIKKLSLQFSSIHLLLGGESKGIDRSALISKLQGTVTHIYCFGKEAVHLYTFCSRLNIPASFYATLDDAFRDCVKQATDQSCVLLSPAGSSYDLFKNYQERGDYFTSLTKQFMTES